MLGKPTWDASQLMVTMGIKEIMKNMGEDEMEIQALQRKVEILKGYLAKVVGPLDPKHPEETLNTILREGGAVHMDPFLRACQKWRESFEEKGVMIIIANLKMFYITQENVN